MKIAILSSGVALGVYIPGLYIHRDLKLNNTESEVFVLENLLIDEKKNKINENKKAFHNNFRVALMGQKIAGDITDSLDPQKTKELFKYWADAGYNYFILLSGFWLSVINFYQNLQQDMNIGIECLHIDSDFSPSWKKANYEKRKLNNSWLMSAADKKIYSLLDIAKHAPIPYAERQDELLLHGGGWGMGTYLSKISQLKLTGLHLNIVAYEFSEISDDPAHISYFMPDPTWSPWLTNSQGAHEFPPFAEVIPGELPIFKSNTDYPGLFNISRKVKAIVSKPGGSTLLDSLESATPLVLLEGFGEHEEKNAHLWQTLGFGIAYKDWEAAGFDLNILEKLHLNLLSEQENHPKYVDLLIKRIGDHSIAAQNNHKI